MRAPDICIAWLSVHGGAFHKLLTLHAELGRAGVACELLIAAGPPLGLQVGLDLPEALAPELAAQGVHFLPRAEVLARAEASEARLLLTDAHLDPDLPGLIAAARRRGAATAQMATLLGDFACHGADHLLLHHPLTLFFELEYHHTRESRRIIAARGLHFTGNVFFEPTLNELHGGFASRQAFFAKYGLDESRGLCLWMPNAADARHEDYARVLRAAADAGLNVLAKLHPWEYAFKKYGVDVWGLGRPSDELWGARAVDEADGTWACRFCDLAVMRASATCLEMPFWEKPSLLLPSTAYPGLVRAQGRLVERCAARLGGVDELPAHLAAPPRPTATDYAAARANLRLDTARDAYAQTVAALAAILADPEGAGIRPTRAGLGRLYDPLVSRDMAGSLSPTRRLRFEAGRLWRRLTG